ncbi:hypothetical protein C0Q70_19615 [Pomacea canaliculata]|uniref:Uncharacterized protein n=1 Tax=Pomacea canaliculata TaxID=400727 RepID=A0A2T7NJU6_POMCA|nr:hypothetical protein C0Q70_19615 [Pomacea canaliculata]
MSSSNEGVDCVLTPGTSSPPVSATSTQSQSQKEGRKERVRLNLVCRGRCSVVSHVSCDGNSASYLPLSYLQNESLERLSPEA